MVSTLTFKMYGFIVQTNNNHFDPVVILEEIIDLRALVNYEAVVEHENLMFVTPDQEEDIGHDSMNLVVEPFVAATPETDFLNLPVLTMASTAVDGIFRGLIGGPIMVGELFVQVAETMTTTHCPDNFSRTSPEEKRRRVKPKRFMG